MRTCWLADLRQDEEDACVEAGAEDEEVLCGEVSISASEPQAGNLSFNQHALQVGALVVADDSFVVRCGYGPDWVAAAVHPPLRASSGRRASGQAGQVSVQKTCGSHPAWLQPCRLDVSDIAAASVRPAHRLPRSRDFYHTCYCLSGLSSAQWGDYVTSPGRPVVHGDIRNLIVSL